MDHRLHGGYGKEVSPPAPVPQKLRLDSWSWKCSSNSNKPRDVKETCVCMNPQREDTSHEAELITGQQLESFFVPRRLQRLQQLCASVRRCNHKYHSFPALRNDKHLALRTLFSFFRVLQKNGRNRLDLSAGSTKRLQCLCVFVCVCVLAAAYIINVL